MSSAIKLHVRGLHLFSQRAPVIFLPADGDFHNGPTTGLLPTDGGSSPWREINLRGFGQAVTYRGRCCPWFCIANFDSSSALKIPQIFLFWKRSVSFPHSFFQQKCITTFSGQTELVSGKILVKTVSSSDSVLP